MGPKNNVNHAGHFTPHQFFKSAKNNFRYEHYRAGPNTVAARSWGFNPHISADMAGSNKFIGKNPNSDGLEPHVPYENGYSYYSSEV